MPKRNDRQLSHQNKQHTNRNSKRQQTIRQRSHDLEMSDFVSPPPTQETNKQTELFQSTAHKQGTQSTEQDFKNKYKTNTINHMSNCFVFYTSHKKCTMVKDPGGPRSGPEARRPEGTFLVIISWLWARHRFLGSETSIRPRRTASNAVNYHILHVSKSIRQQISGSASSVVMSF